MNSVRLVRLVDAQGRWRGWDIEVVPRPQEPAQKPQSGRTA